jgi:tellurite resistance protein
MSKDATAIQLLYAMAVADGHLDEEEMQQLANIAVSRGVSAHEFADMVNNPEKYGSAQLPSDPEGKRRLIIEAATVMMADGKIDDNEYALLEKIAIAMGIPFEEFKRILTGE